MMAHSGGVTAHLLDTLLKDQAKSAEKEKKMSFAEKLRVLDRLMADGEPVIEDTIEEP